MGMGGDYVCMKAKDIIRFWFEETQPKQRWMKDESYDALLLRERFTEAPSTSSSR